MKSTSDTRSTGGSARGKSRPGVSAGRAMSVSRHGKTPDVKLRTAIGRLVRGQWIDWTTRGLREPLLNHSDPAGESQTRPRKERPLKHGFESGWGHQIVFVDLYGSRF